MPYTFVQIRACSRLALIVSLAFVLLQTQATTGASNTGLSVATSSLSNASPPALTESSYDAPPVLNPRTGLLEHIVRIHNPSTEAMRGYQLVVLNCPPELQLHNRSHAHLPLRSEYVDIPPQSHIDIVIAYYSPLRRQPRWKPEYQVKNLNSVPFNPYDRDFSGLYQGWITPHPTARLSKLPNLGARLEFIITPWGVVTGSIIEGKLRRSFRSRVVFRDHEYQTACLALTVPLADFGATLDLFDFDDWTGTLTMKKDGTVARAHTYRTFWRIQEPCPYIERNHFLIRNFSPGAGPQGYGFGIEKPLGTAGRCTVAGRLADGTPFSNSAYFGLSGEVVVYTALHGSKGSVVGMVNHAYMTSGYIHEESNLSWTRPKLPSNQGFGPSPLNAVGHTYRPPNPGEIVFEFGPADPAGTANVHLDFSLGALAASSREFVQGINLSNPGPTSLMNLMRVVPANRNRVTITHFNARTGLFAGRFKAPGLNSGSFRGLLGQPLNNDDTHGYGYYLSQGVPGRMTLKAGPPELTR
jgi:hypothetical protein